MKKAVASFIVIITILIVVSVATVIILLYNKPRESSTIDSIDLSKLGKTVGDFVIEYRTSINFRSTGSSYLAALYNINITEYSKLVKMGKYFLSYSNVSTGYFGGVQQEKLLLIKPSFSKVCEKDSYNKEWNCSKSNENIDIDKIIEEAMQRNVLLGEVSLKSFRELESEYGQKLIDVVQFKKRCINNIQCICVNVDFKDLYHKLMEYKFYSQGTFKANKAIYNACYDESTNVLLELNLEMSIEGYDSNGEYISMTGKVNRYTISYKKSASIEDFIIPGLEREIEIS